MCINSNVKYICVCSFRYLDDDSFETKIEKHTKCSDYNNSAVKNWDLKIQKKRETERTKGERKKKENLYNYHNHGIWSTDFETYFFINSIRLLQIK